MLPPTNHSRITRRIVPVSTAGWAECRRCGRPRPSGQFVARLENKDGKICHFCTDGGMARPVPKASGPALPAFGLSAGQGRKG